MTAVIGVDPGQRATGVVVRAGGVFVEGVLVTPAVDDLPMPALSGMGPGYLRAVLAAVEDLASRHGASLAVEGVVRPNPHMNRRNGNAVIDPAPILATGIMLGAVLGRWPSAVVVRPGSNGSAPLLAYPAELVSAAERRQGMNRVGGGKLRHLRSAWDVAGQACMQPRKPATLWE